MKYMNITGYRVSEVKSSIGIVELKITYKASVSHIVGWHVVTSGNITVYI